MAVLSAGRSLAAISLGSVIATAMVAAVSDGKVFRNGRQFAAWLGLTPRQHSTGGKTRLGRITKRGDAYLRRLLVSAAHYILGPFGPASALRDYGLMLAADGTARAKKRAVVAVARKLCVLLLSN